MRSGTENVTLISAFGAAVDFLAPTVNKRLEKAEELKSYLLQRLENTNGAYAHSFCESSPYIVSITAENIKSETLLHYLESKEIYVSSGSACSKGKKSSVLAAFHYNDRELDSTIRVSLCADTTKEDIDTFIAELENAIGSLCKIR
jgi:cysteine desulfurase